MAGATWYKQRRKAVLGRIIDGAVKELQPKSGVFITLRNPDVKTMCFLGRPVKTKKKHDEFLIHSDCTFDLPIDWHKVQPPEDAHPGRDVNEADVLIVARQVGTNRCVVVHNTRNGGCATAATWN